MLSNQQIAEIEISFVHICVLDIVDMSTHFTFYEVHHLKSTRRHSQRKNI